MVIGENKESSVYICKHRNLFWKFIEVCHQKFRLRHRASFMSLNGGTIEFCEFPFGATWTYILPSIKTRDL